MKSMAAKPAMRHEPSEDDRPRAQQEHRGEEQADRRDAVLPLLGQDQAERAAHEAARPRDRERHVAGVAPLHQVLRVEREGEQPESPELVAEHLERREPERGGGASGDLLQARHHVAHDLRRLARRSVVSCATVSTCRMRRAIRAHTTRTPAAGDHDGPGRERHTGREREGDAHHLEQGPARLGQAVTLQQVFAREDVGDRRGLHREDHAHSALGRQERRDQRDGGRDVALGRGLAEREHEGPRHHHHDTRPRSRWSSSRPCVAGTGR